MEDSAYFGPRTTETAAAVVRELAKLDGENIQLNENWEGPSSGGRKQLGALEPDLIQNQRWISVSCKTSVSAQMRLTR